MMKTIKLIFSLIIFGTFLQSCSTDVDLYADYKDITVVYGLLDPTKDTTFIKINKAFLGPGNALEIAQIADSCNYPEKLNCRIIEYSSTAGGNFTQTRVFDLDTITIHDKESGVFYSTNQLVYYTTGTIRNNTDFHRYKYALEIDHADTTLRGETNIVGGPSFSIVQSYLNLSNKIPNGTIKFYPCPNAAIYDAEITFRYLELTPNNDTIPRYMNWKLETKADSDFLPEHGQYNYTFNPSVFQQMLAYQLGDDTLKMVDRLLEEYPLTVKISAGGEELYNFISVNGPSTSISQNVPEYSNIAGGYGVFSSRTHIIKNVKMSPQSLTELTVDHENWRFRQI